jgi:uncharacterized membrane protein YczE
MLIETSAGDITTIHGAGVGIITTDWLTQANSLHTCVSMGTEILIITGHLYRFVSAFTRQRVTAIFCALIIVITVFIEAE